MTYDKENLRGVDLEFRKLVEKYFKIYSPKTNLDYIVTSFSRKMHETNNIALELATYNYKYDYFMKGKLFTNYGVTWVIGNFDKFFIVKDSDLRNLYHNRKEINTNEGRSVVNYFERYKEYKLALVDCNYLESLPQVKKVNIVL